MARNTAALPSERERIIARDKETAKKLRLECIRAGFVLPRSGDLDEKKVWDEGETNRKASKCFT